MAKRSRSKKQQLEEYLRQREPAAIAEENWHELVSLLAPISENYLRQLLHSTGLPIAQPFGGVRLGSFRELEESLLAMEKEYAQAVASKDALRAKACRRAVIQAKDRARLISRNEKVDPEKRKQKAEMAEWILVWLENPAIFGTWIELRKRMPAVVAAIAADVLD